MRRKKTKDKEAKIKLGVEAEVTVERTEIEAALFFQVRWRHRVGRGKRLARLVKVQLNKDEVVASVKMLLPGWILIRS